MSVRTQVKEAHRRRIAQRGRWVTGESRNGGGVLGVKINFGVGGFVSVTERREKKKERIT